MEEKAKQEKVVYDSKKDEHKEKAGFRLVDNIVVKKEENKNGII